MRKGIVFKAAEDIKTTEGADIDFYLMYFSHSGLNADVIDFKEVMPLYFASEDKSDLLPINIPERLFCFSDTYKNPRRVTTTERGL